jgi:hypothetical protein
MNYDLRSGMNVVLPWRYSPEKFLISRQVQEYGPGEGNIPGEYRIKGVVKDPGKG